MARTRRTPLRFTRDGDDHPSDRFTKSAESSENVAHTSISKDTFKTSLQQFRHDGKDENTKLAFLAVEPSYRNGRKRPLEDDSDQMAKQAPSPSPAKKARQSSKYTPPSAYAHLPKLLDVLEPDLICVFVGVNPGIRTATSGHAYAHPSNLFWKLLHWSGCTEERLKPEQDVELPKLYSMGNTNIVERPTRDAGELSKAEMAEGTPVLEAKIREYRPEAVCIVGKGIWEAVWRWRYKKNIRKEDFKYGWQNEKERMGKDESWAGAKVFVATSTSGLSANLKPPEKEAIWKPFGQWVKARRAERAGEVKVEGEIEVKDERYGSRDEPKE